MFEILETRLVHEVFYRSSGGNGRRGLTLPVLACRYRSHLDVRPTFLATADLQGRETGPANRLLGEHVAEEIMALQQRGELPELDLCLLCGDFYDYPDLHKLGGTGDVTSAFNALSRVATLTVAVLGNHDEITAHGLAANIDVLDGTVGWYGELRIGGVSGIIGNPRRNQRKTDADFLTALRSCSRSSTDVVLLHQGPEGPTPAHAGLDLINRELSTRNDLLVICGHCHWPDPFHTEGRNLFCNVDSRVIVFIPAE